MNCIEDRIKAFTLTEVIIVMTVSSIVVSVAVTFFILIGKISDSLSADYDFTSDTTYIRSVLEKELRSAEEVIQAEDGSIVLKLPDGSESRINLITGTGIVFIDENTDTLFVKINNWEAVRHTRVEELISGLSIFLERGRNEFPVRVSRTLFRVTVFNSQVYED